KVLRVKVAGVVTVEGRPAIRHDGATLMLVSLGEVLKSGDATVITDKEDACVVVLRCGGGQIGVVVEAFIGVNDFVVRPLDIGGRQRPWSGVMSTEDGAPCLVLHANAFAGSEVRHVSNILFKTRQQQSRATKVVLVVDDSITTRTLEKSILEAHGYKVRLS